MSQKNGLSSTFRILAVALVFSLAAGSAQAQTYQLVWADEFDGTTLGPDWVNEVVPGSAGGNNSLQYYTDRPENCRVENGYLVIESRQEQYLDHDYTSALVKTDGHQSWLYGKFEARIQVPVGKGYWPAFWALPQDWVYGGWPSSGEIDIMEMVNDMTQQVGTIHWGKSAQHSVSSSGTYSLPGNEPFSNDFHVYSLEWTPTTFTWSVDGNPYYTTSRWNGGSYPEPFDQRFFLILNVAIGGNWPGAPDATTVFPQQMLVDWVRVYQYPNDPPTVVMTTPQPGSTYPAGSDITIAADAFDTDGTITKVNFYGGASGLDFLGEDTTEPYSYTWTNVGDGCYVVRAEAVDDGGQKTSASADITVGIGCPQLPYYGDPLPIPGTVEAEDFDLGPNGEAYYDDSVGNAGGAYRTDVDVDIEQTQDTGGGFNVGWSGAGEWMEYTVDVTAAGDYDLFARVASNATGGAFHVEFDGVDKTGPVIVPVTGDWQNWTTVSASVTLDAGLQVMRWQNANTADEYNLNYFLLAAAGSGSCGNGVCEAGEDCSSCASDCDGVTGGKPANRFCCGNGVAEGPEGDGSICDGNY